MQMLKLTLEDLAAEVELLKQRLDAISPIAPAVEPEAAVEAEPPKKKSALTPKMLDYLRRCEEERLRLGLPKGPSLAQRMPKTFASTCVLPEDAASQVDHYLYGHPKR